MDDLIVREGQRMILAFARAFDALSRAQDGFKVEEFALVGRIDYVVSQLDLVIKAVHTIRDGMEGRYRWVNDQMSYQRSLLDGQQSDIPF